LADSEAEVVETAETTAPQAQPVPSAPDAAATLKEAMAANDRARVAAQKERDQYAKDLEAARVELAKHEQANMSELEKAQRERDEAKADADKARADAARLRLEAKYPNAVQSLEGEPLPSEETLARLEVRLKPATAAVETPEAPPIIPNPARASAADTRPQSAADLIKLIDERAPAEHPHWYNR
jgi:chromosome segregation ATPase